MNKYLCVFMMGCMFFFQSIGQESRAQVQSLNPESWNTGDVSPQTLPPRPGSVAPLPIDDPVYNYVMAEGKASIHDGMVDSARKAALRAAYADAVSRAAGVEIGTLTMVRNVHKVSDVVMSRSKGFIRQYEIIREGIAASDPHLYEMVIRAEVLTHGVSSEDEIDGLRLYLEILNNPGLLILLPEHSLNSFRSDVSESMSAKGVEIQTGDTQVRIMETGKSHTSNTQGQPKETPENGLILRGGEAAMAQAFSRYGYRVMTSDELVAEGLVGPDIIASARRGVTRDALTAARAAGAELALIGVLRFSENLIQPAGVDLVMVSAEVSAKSVITSSGRNLSVFHQTYRGSAQDRLSAYSHALQQATEGIAGVLAWKIPQILAQESRETRLIIHELDFAGAEKIRLSLLNSAEIDQARIYRLPTPQNQSVELVLLSSFLGLEPGYVVGICQKELMNSLEIISGDRFKIELKKKVD
jgi:hypothetical protein